VQNTQYWWKEKRDYQNEIFPYLKRLDSEQGYRGELNMRWMRMYGNYDVVGLQNWNYARVETASSIQNRVTLNVVQSMIDTVHSKITKNKPKPLFLTDGGDWSAQRKAKKLNKFVEGQFYMTNLYEKTAQGFLDSCIFGTGAVKIYRQGNKICSERVFINEIKVDDNEAIYGDPRQMHQTKYIHREVLKEMYPEYATQIDSAGERLENYELDPTQRSRVNMLCVVESWHLPSGEEATDGKHVITIENQTLFEEPYTKTYFPFIFFRWGLRPLGFFGQGLAEQLQGLQLEINKILRTIQISMHLVSIPKLLVEVSSKVVSSHLDNKIGGIIKYAGTPPKYEPLGGVPAELFSHLDRLYARAYEIAGVNTLSAQGQIPTGLNGSGKAMRTYNDLETERFMSIAQRWEAAHLEAAKMCVDLGREIHEEFGEYSVNVKNKDSMETIRWKDVDLDKDSYIMQLFPTSSLSNTPAGRLADIQDLLSIGFIGKEDGMKLLDFPDLRHYYNLANSPIEDIERTMEMFIDDGEYQTPEPYQNLELGIVKMQQAYLMYKTQGAPEDRLELFRRWMDDANDLLKKARGEAEAPAAPINAAAMPPAAPVEPGMVVPDPNAVPVPVT